MTLVGKFGLQPSTYGSQPSIFKITRETSQMVYCRMWVEPRFGAEGYFATRDTRQYKEQFSAFVDTFEEAEKRRDKARQRFESMEGAIREANKLARELVTDRNLQVERALRGEL